MFGQHPQFDRDGRREQRSSFERPEQQQTIGNLLHSIFPGIRQRQQMPQTPRRITDPPRQPMGTPQQPTAAPGAPMVQQQPMNTLTGNPFMPLSSQPITFGSMLSRQPVY